MVLTIGLEPTYFFVRSEMFLQLNYASIIWLRGKGSNLQSSVSKTEVLFQLDDPVVNLVQVSGFEPLSDRLRVCDNVHYTTLAKLVRGVGF